MVALGLGLLLAACSGEDGEQATVEMYDNFFEPEGVTAATGTTVVPC